MDNHVRNDTLVDELARLNIPFLRGGTEQPNNQPIYPTTFICELATNDEARLRLALIPLFLRRPEYAVYVPHAYQNLVADAQIILACYYTASYLLQRKYSPQLHVFYSVMNWLPDLFSKELAIITSDVDVGLRILDERHKELSGRKINWLGTYEHGAQKLLKFMKRKQR